MLWEALILNLEFLNKQQAIFYFNKQTNLDIDRRTFLIYCLENEIPIKYKAITEFKAIMGFLISFDEYTQLREHESIKADFEEKEDNTIYAQKSFDEQLTSLTYKLFKKVFPIEYDSKDIMLYMNTLIKCYELVKEEEDYKELLSKKDYLDRLIKIKEASRILLDGENGGLVFHKENVFNLKSGIYDFLDSSFSSKGLIQEEIKNYQDGFYDSFIPTKTRFFISDNLFYWKANEENQGILGSFSTDEIFQQGFLKADIDLLIKKLSQKEKTVKEVDMLHPRTANNASKIISALCELNGLDITQPYGNSNKEIMGVLDRLGTPLSKDVVGDWLKLAHENTK